MSFALLTKLLLLVAMADVAGGSAAPAAAPASSASTPAAPPARPRLPADAFPLERKPRPLRAQAWTKARHGFSPKWESEHRGTHFSRFLDLARPRLHPPKVRERSEADRRIDLARFATAVVTDLRDVHAEACPPGRCMPELADAVQLLARALAEHARDFTYVESPQDATPGGTWYGWQLAFGEVGVTLGCYDMAESAEVACHLEIPLTDELVLDYTPKGTTSPPGPDLTIRSGDDRRRVGEIEIARTYDGAPVVIVGGVALRRP